MTRNGLFSSKFNGEFRPADALPSSPATHTETAFLVEIGLSSNFR